MAKNNGKPSESAFVARIVDREGAVTRLTDAAALRGINGGRHVNDFAKPGDWVVTLDQQTFLAETKSCQSDTSFPFSNIEKGQHVAATAHTRAGGDYRFFIFSYGLGQWFIMSGAVYLAALDEGRASIKFKELPEWT